MSLEDDLANTLSQEQIARERSDKEMLEHYRWWHSRVTQLSKEFASAAILRIGAPKAPKEGLLRRLFATPRGGRTNPAETPAWTLLIPVREYSDSGTTRTWIGIWEDGTWEFVKGVNLGRGKGKFVKDDSPRLDEFRAKFNDSSSDYLDITLRQTFLDGLRKTISANESL